MALPPNQADRAWPKLVHQDAEWKRGGAQQEGANGETQIQHLFLVHAAEPLIQLVAGGRVAQGHDHGIVLCEEGQRARLQERKHLDFGPCWEPGWHSTACPAPCCRVSAFPL